MPARKTTPKQSQNLKRGFKAEAERTASLYRKALALADNAPMPARELATHLGITILIPQEIPGITQALLDVLLGDEGREQWSAAIFTKNDKKYIIHNPTHSLARQESNIMHEVSHAICKHQLKELEYAIKGMVIPLREYDHVQEAEAEHLGACLQLPRTALVHHYCILKRSNEQIAQIFNASKKMVSFRLSVTGVSKLKFGT